MKPSRSFAHKSARAFTLAELLIALVILGVISTFTIPKVLSSQQDDKKKAVFRESIATLSQILNQGVQDGSLKDVNSGKGQYFLDRLNAVRICPTNSDTQGCWNSAVQGSGYGSEHLQPGALLHNGAEIIGLNDNGAVTYNAFVVDWNGADPPNAQGDDQLWMRMCWGPASCTGQYAGSGTVAPGTIGPYLGAAAANLTLYNSIFN